MKISIIELDKGNLSQVISEASEFGRINGRLNIIDPRRKIFAVTRRNGDICFFAVKTKKEIKAIDRFFFRAVTVTPFAVTPKN